MTKGEGAELMLEKLRHLLPLGPQVRQAEME